MKGKLVTIRIFDKIQLFQTKINIIIANLEQNCASTVLRSSHVLGFAYKLDNLRGVYYSTLK